MKAVSRGK